MVLTFKIHKNHNVVFEYLTDLQKFVSVHPVISHIKNTGNGSYLVYETLKIGIIPFSFTYPVTIEKSTKDKTVTIRATVFKLVKIDMKFILTADNDFTIIEEQVEFTSPLPIVFIMERTFKKQHSKLFKNIEDA